jgi:hypothetical protein
MLGWLARGRTPKRADTPEEVLGVAWDQIAKMVTASNDDDPASFLTTFRALSVDTRMTLAASLLLVFSLRRGVIARIGHPPAEAELTSLARDLYPYLHRMMPLTTVQPVQNALTSAFGSGEDQTTVAEIVSFIGHGTCILAALAQQLGDPLLGLRPSEACRWVLTQTTYEASFARLAAQQLSR